MDRRESITQRPLALKVVLGALQMAAHDRRQPALVVVEDRRDLAQRQPELAQRDDPIQPLHVGVTVQPVPRGRALRRHEQPEPVVVMQRLDRQARRRRKLADPPAPIVARHGSHRMPSPRGMRKSQMLGTSAHGEDGAGPAGATSPVSETNSPAGSCRCRSGASGAMSTWRLRCTGRRRPREDCMRATRMRPALREQ